MLAYEFYEMVLIELRSWGGDLHALDIVYQFIGRRASNHGDQGCDQQVGKLCDVVCTNCYRKRSNYASLKK